jgi:putative photosynthetic complex assembly protein
MTARAIHSDEAKPFAVIFAGLVLVVVLIGSARLAGYRPPPTLPADVALQTRVLQVEDSSLGSVVVRDGKTGDLIATYKRGEGSFFRATLRTLVHDRMHKGLSLAGNFRLETHGKNQLFLIDEVSGKTLAMNAFGPSNAAVFAALLSTPKLSNSKAGESQ